MLHGDFPGQIWDHPRGTQFFPQNMDGDGQLPIGASLVRKSHQLDKNKGQEQRRKEIEGRILVAGDAEIGASLLAGQFQINLAVAGDVADVAVLKDL